MAVYSLIFRPNKYQIRFALLSDDANLLSCVASRWRLRLWYGPFLIDPISTQPYYILQFNLLDLLSFSFMSLV